MRSISLLHKESVLSTNRTITPFENRLYARIIASISIYAILRG